MLRGLACLTVLAALLVAGCGASDDRGARVAQAACRMPGVPGTGYGKPSGAVWWTFPGGWSVTVRPIDGGWMPDTDGCHRLAG